MGKLDTSTIQGFDTMSDADKVNALLGLDIPDRVDMSKYVSKQTFDTTSSQLAEAKRKIKALSDTADDGKQSDGSKTDDGEVQQQLQALQAAYDKLLKENTIAKNKAEFIKMGYSEALAESSAEALFNGDTAKLFMNGIAFKSEFEQSLRAETMRKTPRPDGNTGADGGEAKPKSVELAEKIGKQTADGNKRANDVLNYYKIGGHV